MSALMDRLDHEDSPTMLLSQSLGVEMPLDRPMKAGRGSVIQAYLSRPIPGRFEGVFDLARRAFDFVEAHGAMNCHLYTLMGAGMMSDAMGVSWELENMRALGRLGDAYMTDPAGQAIMQILTGPDCPVTPISDGVYTEISL
jgi:hypothetical protein